MAEKREFGCLIYRGISADLAVKEAAGNRYIIGAYFKQDFMRGRYRQTRLDSRSEDTVLIPCENTMK